MSTLKLTVIADPSKFRAGMAAASKDLKKFQYTADKAGQAMKKAMGAAGLGLGVAQLAGYLKQAGRAAAEDAVSQRQLAIALKNTVGANSAAISGAEDFIQKTSQQVAILDDDLRPALAKAVRFTGSLKKGQDLLNLALDVSAGSGKNLDTTMTALGKAYNGNVAGLKRLGVNIKDAKNFQQELAKSFKGSAAAAAATNPYQQLSVTLDNMKETIGSALLPAIQEFAAYLNSTDGQRTLKQLITILQQIGKGFVAVASFVVRNIALIKSLVAAFIFVKLAIGGITLAMKLYEIATRLAAISTKSLKLALLSTGVGALIVLVGTLAESWAQASENQDTYMKGTPQWLKNLSKLFGFYDVKRSQDAFQNRWINMGKFFQAQKTKMLEIQKQAVAEFTKVGEKFRDSVGLAFGTAGTDEYSVFNVDKVINKLKRMVDAAKGFKENIKKLIAQGAGADVIAELTAMGPAQGNIVAKGLLTSGRLSEYLGLRGSLFATGYGVAQVGAGANNKTYQIDIKEENQTAQAIIVAIQAYEKKTGRKYFVTNGKSNAR